MKSIFSLFLAAGLAVSAVSCGAANDPYYGNNGGYGYPSGTVYRAGDGTVYRQGEVYRDRQGNVYQNGRIVRREGNVYSQYPNRRNLPPGQAKKVYGGDARDYAPGQVKKRYRNYDEGDDRHDSNGKRHGHNGKNKR